MLDVLGDLFALLFCFSFLGVCGLTGFIVFNHFKKKDNKRYKPYLIGCIVVFIASFILTGVTLDSTKKEQPQTVVKTEKTSTKEKNPVAVQTTHLKQNEKIYTVGLTPDEFKEKFNKFSSENNLPFEIPDLTIEKGEVQDVFKVIFSNNLALNGTVNKKDGSLRDILVIGQPTKNAADNLNIILVFGTAMAAINPELTAKERGQLLKDCGLIGENVDYTNLNKSTVRGNIEYHATFTEGIGFMLTISSVDDK